MKEGTNGREKKERKKKKRKKEKSFKYIFLLQRFDQIKVYFS